MMQVQEQAPKIKSLLESSNSFYYDLLGYKPEKTSLQQVPEFRWFEFMQQNGLNPDYNGIYLPRNQTAIIKGENILSFFHEYFGHGLYCEQSLTGRKIVRLEKKLLEEERQEFQGRRFTLEDIQKFRGQNPTFQRLDKFRIQNLEQYELFAVWTEYLLSRKFELRNKFEKKYDLLSGEKRNDVDSVINFSETYGDLATFYLQGLARITTTERVKKLLEGIYGEKKIKNSRLVLLTGSKKPFSDIDLFAVGGLEPIKNEWIDLVSFGEKDFERRVKLFEVQVTHPIILGEFVAGDLDYLQQKREQLKKQPITEKAIEYNLQKSREQNNVAHEYPKNSEERIVGLSYSQTYLTNALALKKGKRLFTKENLLSYSHSEADIQLKGGKENEIRTTNLSTSDSF